MIIVFFLIKYIISVIKLDVWLKKIFFVILSQRKKNFNLNYIQQVRAINEERRKKLQETQWNYQVYPNLYSTTQKVAW